MCEIFGSLNKLTSTLSVQNQSRLKTRSGVLKVVSFYI